MSLYHTSVMLAEAVNALHVSPGKRYIDATVGGGGHGLEIIKRGGILLGIDADREAIEITENYFNIETLKLKIKKNWQLIQGNFRDIKRIAIENDFDAVDGILFDLGVSSHQFDTPKRGFSYRFSDASLDMRLDQSKGITAKELLETAHKEELYEIFAGVFGWSEDHSVEEILKTARPYLSKLRPLGESALTIGLPLLLWQKKEIAGTVIAGPFECMPTRIAETQLALISEQTGLPVLNLSFSGEPLDRELIESFIWDLRN